MIKETLKGTTILPYTIEIEMEEDDAMYSCHVPEYGLYFSAKDLEAAQRKANAMVLVMVNFLVEQNNKLKVK